MHKSGLCSWVSVGKNATIALNAPFAHFSVVCNDCVLLVTCQLLTEKCGLGALEMMVTHLSELLLYSVVSQFYRFGVNGVFGSNVHSLRLSSQMPRSNTFA